MAPVRKRTATNIARRRRLDDEDENQSVATEPVDSQSDVSASDVDEHADADNSDLSDVDSAPSLTDAKAPRKHHNARGVKPSAPAAAHRQPSPPIARSDVAFTSLPDTQRMLNGLHLTDAAEDAPVVDFETGQDATPVPAPAVSGQSARPETLGERRRREHEEYKKKRDSDPAFIPNRGAFFMHDQRSAPGPNGFRPAGTRGRGRGGAIGGPFSPAHLRQQPPEATDSPWQHDLHETINVPGAHGHTHAHGHTSPAVNGTGPRPMSTSQLAAKAPPASAQKPVSPRNFSSTVHTHNAVIRVFLPDMKAPILFQNVPIKQHTRLPNHRPPLRRDKPVRISLPPSAPRYIFPTNERSFIFIPRALRPNQQGFGRGRGRFGSFGGGFSSRRTSAYGGSVYSPSVAMSRRSSMAREMGRDNLVSPAGSIMSRNGAFNDPTRPVVRLPPGGPRLSNAPSVVSPTAPILNGNGLQQPYPLPQNPTFRENWQGQLPMHQPRPQKTVSVAGIESPASISFNPPQQQEQQPFHQQVPTHMQGAAAPSTEQSQFYQHARQLSYPSQGANGTPLSNIPERAIHAPAFQPYTQPGFPPQPYVPQPYFYPPNTTQPQYLPPAAVVPMFVPAAQQPGYAVPVAAPTAPVPVPTHAHAPPAAPVPASQPSNMIAYESNGMTFYVDSSQLYAAPPPPPPPAPPQQQGVPVEGYAQPSYAVPGMGGMMTPGPDGGFYYPQHVGFYGAQ